MTRHHRLTTFAFSICLAWGSQVIAAPLGKQPSNSALTLAEQHLARHEFSEVVSVLERYLSVTAEPDERAYAMLGRARLGLGQAAQAVQGLEKGLERFPGNEELERLFASALEQAGNGHPYVSALERQLERRPASRTFRKALGYALMRQNPLDRRAERLLADAAATDPRDAEARFLYGQWACLNNKDTTCISELQAALALSPSSDYALMQIHTLIGLAHRNLQNAEEADRAFREALLRNRRLPSLDPRSAYQYVKFLLESSRNEEAAALVDEILRLSPAFGPARYERARALSRAGKLAEAAAQGELALQTLERDDASLLSAAHAFMARTYFALGKANEAKVHQEWIEKSNR